ncbi:MAG: hypothetical protein P8184_20645 [Calditrichia bacterium]
MRNTHILLLKSLLLIILLAGPVFSCRAGFPKAPKASQVAPNVYLDCRFCDFDFIRSEIPYVNYVYDRSNADIYILITRQSTGSGGREYTLSFLGQGSSSAYSDTLSFVTLHDATDDEVRHELTRHIEIGLIPYIYNTKIMESLSIEYKGKRDSLVVDDKWKLWFFRINLGGHLEGEAASSNYSYSSTFSADRITENWKIKFRGRYSYEKDSYDIDEGTLTSSESHKNFSLLTVKSLTPHWSVGVSTHLSSSTYDNISSSLSAAPGIEYNFYPYSESTRREFRLLYEIGYEIDHYYEETIFSKMKEVLLQESLEIGYETKNPWGRIDIFIRGSHFLHDFRKNHLSLYSEISLRLYKGFSLYLEGGYSRIRDQLALPKSEVTIDEVLLQRRQLETQYSYWGDVGLEFSFGSIYNNIVNPRFGD